MPTIDITEYSAVGLLFLLVVAGGWLVWRWLGGYNERAKTKALAEQRRLDRDYEDRRKLSEAMIALVEKDIKAKEELASTLRALTAEIERNNGAVEATMNEMCRSLRSLSDDHERAERRAAMRHEEALAK